MNKQFRFIRRQRGFTLYELLAVGAGLAWIAAIIGIIYVIGHFIAKFW
jgi:Tfp pilus assembly protein FimT